MWILSVGQFIKYFYLNEQKKVKKILKKFLFSQGPCLLEVAIKQEVMRKLVRPKNLIKVKNQFMRKV